MVLLFQLSVIRFGDGALGHSLHVAPRIAVGLHVLEAHVAGLSLHVEGSPEIYLCGKVAVLEIREGVRVSGFGIGLQGFVGGEGVTFLLKVFCVHETGLRGLEGDESELFL